MEAAIDLRREADPPFYLPQGDECRLFEAAPALRLPVLLKRPTGCGKTRFVAHMAERLGRRLTTVSCHDDLTAAGLTGRHLLKGGETVWVDGPLTASVRGGGICYLDEVVEARKGVTVVLHPLTDDRRLLPLERTGELLEAPPGFMLVVSYNPGYQNLLKSLKPSARQRFIAIELDFPKPEQELRIVASESGLGIERVRPLVNLAARVRALKGIDLEEACSTRLLVYAATLIKAGIVPHTAIKHAVVEPLSDDADVKAGLRDLYTWLTAFLAHALPPERVEADPLRRDLAALRAIRRTTARVLEHFPGLEPLHARLGAALLGVRPGRRLPRTEAAVEAAVQALHGGGDGAAGEIMALVLAPEPSFERLRAPRRYRPFLPVPLWGETDFAAAPGRADDGHDEDGAADGQTAEDEDEDEEHLHRHAERMTNDQSDRDALTLINKGELLLTVAEMVDVSRPDDEEDPDAARKAAQDQDTLHLGRPDRRAASRVKMDLDMAANVAVQESTSGEGVRYPE